jgi:nucleoside-diphosphate-sugar epimerase
MALHTCRATQVVHTSEGRLSEGRVVEEQRQQKRPQGASEIAPRRSCYVRGSLADAGLLERRVMSFGVTHIVHLAAQAGVRKSLTAPESYLYNNMEVRSGEKIQAACMIM